MSVSAASFQPVPKSGDLLQKIRHLAEEMQVPIDEIEQIYSNELHRLEAEARIQSFVGVLAIKRTRTILRVKKERSPRP